MSHIRCEYRVNGYSIADALRPDPMYGKRVFFTDRKHFPEATDAEIIEAADGPDAVPKNYWLATIHEGDRVILDRRPKYKTSHQPNEQEQTKP